MKSFKLEKIFEIDRQFLMWISTRLFPQILDPPRI
jgi:hypothetical protein